MPSLISEPQYCMIYRKYTVPGTMSGTQQVLKNGRSYNIDPFFTYLVIIPDFLSDSSSLELKARTHLHRTSQWPWTIRKQNLT